MRPDRIVVGEVRRGEALDLIQSMLSGHDGALSTVHASSPLLALTRLETLCLMNDVDMPVYVARTQVASALHVIAQVARMPDGSRRVREISEVVGLGAGDRYELRPVFRFAQTGFGDDGRIAGELRWSGEVSRFGPEVADARKMLERREGYHICETAGVWGLSGGPDGGPCGGN
jgi:pilus assembly protein CpaF